MISLHRTIECNWIFNNQITLNQICMYLVCIASLTLWAWTITHLSNNFDIIFFADFAIRKLRNLRSLDVLRCLTNRINSMFNVLSRYFILRMSIVERNRWLRKKWLTDETSNIFALFIARIYLQQKIESCQKHRHWLLSRLIEWLTKSWCWYRSMNVKREI